MSTEHEALIAAFSRTLEQQAPVEPPWDEIDAIAAREPLDAARALSLLSGLLERPAAERVALGLAIAGLAGLPGLRGEDERHAGPGLAALMLGSRSAVLRGHGLALLAEALAGRALDATPPAEDEALLAEVLERFEEPSSADGVDLEDGAVHVPFLGPSSWERARLALVELLSEDPRAVRALAARRLDPLTPTLLREARQAPCEEQAATALVGALTRFGDEDALAAARALLDHGDELALAELLRSAAGTGEVVLIDAARRLLEADDVGVRLAAWDLLGNAPQYEAELDGPDFGEIMSELSSPYPSKRMAALEAARAWLGLREGRFGRPHDGGHAPAGRRVHR